MVVRIVWKGSGRGRHGFEFECYVLRKEDVVYEGGLVIVQQKTLNSSTEEDCEGLLMVEAGIVRAAVMMMSDGRVVRARECDSAIFDSIDPNCVAA